MQTNGFVPPRSRKLSQKVSKAQPVSHSTIRLFQWPLRQWTQLRNKETQFDEAGLYVCPCLWYLSAVREIFVRVCVWRKTTYQWNEGLLSILWIRRPLGFALQNQRDLLKMFSTLSNSTVAITNMVLPSSLYFSFQTSWCFKFAYSQSKYSVE